MCNFCDKYQELKIMEHITSDEHSIEQFRMKSGLVMSHAVRFRKFYTIQDHLEGSFELNYCPECGRAIKEKQDEI